VYRDMEAWHRIRRRVLVEGVSKRQILRETGMHWQTLEKILAQGEPPGYRRSKPAAKPKIGPYLDRIEQILESDKQVRRKQRHTAKRIWERLQGEGFTGGYTIVKDAVRRLKSERREVYMPLVHRAGDGQADFGEALVCMGGVLRKVSFFVMALPHSDAVYVEAFGGECTETWQAGHVGAFGFFGFVASRIRYDNTRIAVAKILGPHQRRLTVGFQRLRSHYLFDAQFCRVGRGNEKGVVEGRVKYARQNFFVPVPRVRDFAELNAYLLDRCREELGRKLRGKSATKGQLLAEDRIASLELPAQPFEACRTESTIANSQSLVRFETNDYSVPVAYGHHPVVVKGWVDRVQIGCGGKCIAEHARCWERERQIFDPRHYLPLVLRKPGSLDDARPLEDLALPACFATLRGRLEGEREDGTREYIRVLCLLEKHSLAMVTRAVEDGLRMRVHGRDGIAQFLLPPEPWRASSFRLDGREHLRHVKVASPDVSGYRTLLSCVGGGQ
jgi:transposase